MKGFYYDIFLMLLTYGILTFLCIKLMKARKKKGRGGDGDGGWKKPETPIFPDLPSGIIWPDEVKDKEEVLL